MKQATVINPIEFTRINNDINGNPRYVCHFLRFINDRDRAKTSSNIYQIANLYEIALKKSRQIGGKKFHNKQYGGGIVFQSYNIADLEQRVNEIANQ